MFLMSLACDVVVVLCIDEHKYNLSAPPPQQSLLIHQKTP